MEAPKRSEGVELALASAKEFLQPALSAGQLLYIFKGAIFTNVLVKSGKISTASAAALIAKSSCAVDEEPSFEKLRATLQEACIHLKALHHTIQLQDNSIDTQLEVLDTALVRIVHDLLDVIVIEGLYPSLSPNVGPQQERHKKSLFYHALAISLPNLELVDTILWKTLRHIAFDSSKGLTRVIRDRHLIDIIAAEVDLAHSPTRLAVIKQNASEMLEKSTSKYVKQNAPSNWILTRC
jgi:hypothetical protein